MCSVAVTSYWECINACRTGDTSFRDRRPFTTARLPAQVAGRRGHIDWNSVGWGEKYFVLGWPELCKDLQRRQLRYSSSLPTYSLDERLPYTVEEIAKMTSKVFFFVILWVSGYRTLWKDLQRRQLLFSSSLSTYSLNERLLYTVEGFSKTTAKVFFFVTYIFFGWAVTLRCGRICRFAKTTATVFFFIMYIFFGWAFTVHCGRIYKNDSFGFFFFTNIYSLDARQPYTVEGFAKTTAKVFFFVILWISGNRTPQVLNWTRDIIKYKDQSS